MIRMLRTCKLDRRYNSPTPINGKKTEYRNPYITYLTNLHVMPLSCFILFFTWLWGELHILLNPCEKNVIGMDFLFCGMFILLGFILFYLERCLRYCGDNRKLTYKLQKNVNLQKNKFCFQEISILDMRRIDSSPETVIKKKHCQ